MVESMLLILYPAFKRGVEIAKMPNGAVASMLEKEGTKKTIFFEAFTGLPLGPFRWPFGLALQLFRAPHLRSCETRAAQNGTKGGKIAAENGAIVSHLSKLCKT